MADPTPNEVRLKADIDKLQASKTALITRVSGYSTWIDALLAQLEATAGKGLSEEATNQLFTNLEALQTDIDVVATDKTPPTPLPQPKIPAGI